MSGEVRASPGGGGERAAEPDGEEEGGHEGLSPYGEEGAPNLEVATGAGEDSAAGEREAAGGVAGGSARLGLGEEDLALARVMQLLDDRPGAAFSVHRFVEDGAPYGLEAARWVGPFAVCKTLELLVNKTRPGGLRAYVAADPCGGVPTVYRDTVAQAARSGDDDEHAGGNPAGNCWAPLILLAPVTLGATQAISPAYLAQLRQLFSFPQSLGVVGGRTGSSLYFVGCQADRLMYLDPHIVQEAVQDPAAPSGQELASFRCPHILHMDIGNLNPSLAMGFLCESEGSFNDLCTRIEALAGSHGAAPLITVHQGAQASVAEYTGMDDGSASEGEWELM